MQIVIKGLVEVPKQWLSIQRIAAIKSLLTFDMKDFTDTRVTIPVYEETDDILAIPRFFADSMILNNEFSQTIQNQTCLIPADIQFKSEMDVHPNKPKQDEIVQQVCQDFGNVKWFGGGIVNSVMGFGKTLVALKIASRIKQKTLIVLHRKVLVEQWKNFILKFTNVTEDQIGYIDPDVFVYENKPITLAMLQTLLSRDLTDDFHTNFGFVVLDEASHIAAPVWWQVAKKLHSRYTLGLTGTLAKVNNLHKIIQYTVGTRLYGQSELRVMGDAHIYKYTIYIPNYRHFQHEGSMILPIFVTFLTSNNEYNKFLIKVIKKYVEQGKYLLITTDRVKHAQFLYKVCTELFKDKKFQLLIGGTKVIEYVDGYIGTNQYIAEGIDITHLDTIVLTTPRFSIKQLVGRLFRNLDKKRITVVDIVQKPYPPIGIVEEAFYPRLNAYKNWGLDITMMED